MCEYSWLVTAFNFDSIQFQNSINHLFFKGSKWQKRELQLQLVIFTQSGSIPRLWGLSFTLFYCLQTTVWLPQRFSNDYPGNGEVVFINRQKTIFFTMNETKLKDNVQKTNFIFSKEKIFFQVIIWRTKFIFFWSCWKSLYSVKEHTCMYICILWLVFIYLLLWTLV